MFESLLIANRGEIACRVIRTARRMGLRTIAVYSDADARAEHVRMADEAVRLGPAPAAQSYLDIDAVLAACRESGAEAVHPGYGFLSERAEFARALEEAGIAFVGPPPRAIELMGDKIVSKRFAAEAGVNTIPGHDGEIDGPDEAVEIARQVGLPVMIKASAGGGGKGMRVAHRESEVAEGFARARSEAASAFGDDRVFIERFVVNPRHIEVQVLADRHGNCIHLLERECSVQRRNQKVLEEAPSTFLDAATREEMGRQSVALARAVDYVGAGTVEFVVDADRNFFFLEMNTRLQVEHPVTELVTGVDLVEQMIRAAAGEALGVTQDEIEANGWAIEARVYAESPERGFLPSIGRLTRYAPPAEGALGPGSVRVDDGVTEGSEITVHYDPMIAKLCAWGPDRDAANDALVVALDGFAIDGIEHNLDFLSAIVGRPRWRAGELTTSFIDEEFPDGPGRDELHADDWTTAAAIALSVERSAALRYGGRAGVAGPICVLCSAGGRSHRLDLDVEAVTEAEGDLAFRKASGDRPARVRKGRLADGVWSGQVDGTHRRARVSRAGDGWTISRAGATVHARIMPPRIADLAAIMPEPDLSAARDELRSPMPGTVVSVSVAVGDRVTAGQGVAVIEAMKMENQLRAERDGTVAEIDVAPGAALAVDQRIMRLEGD